MSVTKNTFAQPGDGDFSEDFNALFGSLNTSDYVEQGMQFQNIDYTNLTFDIAEGKAFIYQSSKTISANSETRLGLNYAIHMPTTSGLPLTDTATNYVYLTPNLGTDDGGTYNVYTSKTNAGSDDLLIGTIDTSNDVSEELNRNPAVDVDTLDVWDGALDLHGNDVIGVANVEGATANHNIDLDAPDVRLQVDDGAGTLINAVRAFDGGDVTIPNGRLTAEHNLQVGTADSGNVLNIARNNSTDNQSFLQTSTGNAGIALRYHDGSAYNIGLGVTNSGNVDIPSGRLEIKTTADQLRLYDTDSTVDSNDFFRVSHYDGVLNLNYHDNSTGTNTDFFRFDQSDDSLLFNAGNVDIPNGELTVNGGWVSDTNNLWNAEWRGDIDSETFRGLEIGGTNARFFRLGSSLSSGATHQHDMVFTRNNGSTGTVFGVTTSHDTGGSWNPAFIVDGNEDVKIPTGSLTQGTNPQDTISETTSPTSFEFNGDDGRDIHDQTDVTISNGTTASVTEDITVELYDGADTTGTLVASQTQSVSVGASSTTTTAFITGDVELDNGTYHIEITQSGTTLSIDQTDEYTKGATYTFGQTSTGDLYLDNQDGTPILNVDAITEEVNILNGVLDMNGNNLTNAGGANVDMVANFNVNSGDIQLLGDGLKIAMGASADVASRYDATNDDIRWSDETNAADRMALDRTTGDLSISGTVTEGAAL